MGRGSEKIKIKDIQMVCMHMKTWSSSLINGKMQFKTMRYTSQLFEWLLLTRQEISVSEVVE